MIVVFQSMCAQRSGRLNKFMSCINLGGMQQVTVRRVCGMGLAVWLKCHLYPDW